MEVKILGTGCPKCQKLAQMVTDVAKKNNITIDMEKVTEIDDIMAYNIMMTPGLVINGEVKSAGKLPKNDQILTWLKEG
ncbi:MAG: thioredoxin family protein [Gemmatimonadetes bacterium]|nr:MAG: thioredoxin family protein [Gemmatimonadota bacterium]